MEWLLATMRYHFVACTESYCLHLSQLCSQMGSNILAKGGNAIDAAVTVALCGGVTRPFESGIGGGGIMVLHLSNGTEFVFDFRETAPAAAHKNMFNNSSESHHGGKSIGTAVCAKRIVSLT